MKSTHTYHEDICCIRYLASSSEQLLKIIELVREKQQPQTENNGNPSLVQRILPHTLVFAAHSKAW